MTEPVFLGTLQSATSVFSGFSQFFKPSKSPYLLSGLLCVLSLISIASIPRAYAFFFFGFVPLGIIFSFLSVLCFYFKPYRSKEADTAAIEAEIDEQFKFSRTVCVSVGVLLLTYLLYKVIGADFFEWPFSTEPPPNPIEPGLFFWITYISCLVHLLVFVTYIMFRNIREESSIKLSLFQITFFTMAILLGLVFSCTKIIEQNGILTSNSCVVRYKDNQGNDKTRVLPFACSYKSEVDSAVLKIQRSAGVDPETGTSPQPPILDNNKVLFWYFFVHLLAFETFWIRRLASVVRFKIDLVILE